MKLRVRSARRLEGSIQVPGDKSISHRALLLGALADGTSRARGWLLAGVTKAMLRCVRELGIAVEVQPKAAGLADLTVHGMGLRGWQAPRRTLDCGGSATTMRLLAGALAGQPFTSTLDGSPRLRQRPMRRIVVPLRRMGARIGTVEGNAPLDIAGGDLLPIDYTLPVASAQVKSAILLAGLFAQGPTTVREPGPARDHTERMLSAMGAHLKIDGSAITLTPKEALAPIAVEVPGDLSSAAFFLVAGFLVPGSEVLIEGVGLNPTRNGFLEVLSTMGAKVSVKNERTVGNEPVGDLLVRWSELQGVEVSGPLVVRMIDEFPALAVAATQAQGETVVHDAQELRVKESDRIGGIVGELRKLGAQIEERPDGFVVQGPTPLRGAEVDSHGDHRLAMALAVAGLIAEEETVIRGAECIGESFPGFEDVLRGLDQGT
ncbi:MAG: 3-phosphoshikimate 1-carboxyvinyltransferase [Chloroflexota bacterium]|nr:3-phosphoshikimate 1-carboxyvinyltransferase [Chloroflexota bacterium]